MRKILRGFKTNIYPTKEQEDILFAYCEYSHKMRNFLVEKFKDNLPKVGCYGIIGYNEKKLLEDFSEREIPRIPLPYLLLKGVIREYASSVRRTYKKLTKPPKFHKYIANKQSFYIPKDYSIISNTIVLPLSRETLDTKISRIRAEKAYLEKFSITQVKEPRYTYQNGKWYISGCYEDGITPQKKETTFVGLDWGIKNFMTTSQGELINYPDSVIREYERIKKLVSIRDKKIKGSNNYIKIDNKVNKAWERFYNLKRDFIEQITNKLCKDYNIAVEDLSNAKILKSTKNRRRLKLIAPRYLFIEKAKWKCQKYGTQFIEVNPAYTSKTCSKCGKVKENLSLQDRIFKCECGLELDRDINAAINIAARGACKAL